MALGAAWTRFRQRLADYTVAVVWRWGHFLVSTRRVLCPLGDSLKSREGQYAENNLDNTQPHCEKLRADTGGVATEGPILQAFLLLSYFVVILIDSMPALAIKTDTRELTASVSWPEIKLL
jgi:hypothetical protein